MKPMKVNYTGCRWQRMQILKKRVLHCGCLVDNVKMGWNCLQISCWELVPFTFKLSNEHICLPYVSYLYKVYHVLRPGQHRRGNTWRRRELTSAWSDHPWPTRPWGHRAWWWGCRSDPLFRWNTCYLLANQQTTENLNPGRLCWIPLNPSLDWPQQPFLWKKR